MELRILLSSSWVLGQSHWTRRGADKETGARDKDLKPSLLIQPDKNPFLIDILC